MKACPVLWLIVPCYNEQQVLPVTAPIFLGKITDLISSGSIDKASRILFVNDGSKDRTWDIIESLSRQDNHYSGISLSRNRGHQNALLAGLMEAADNCDITISLDCDGQDDINAVDAMLEEYSAGSEIVYGVRSSRENDTWFKRTTAQAFYRFMSAMGADIVYNHADYRLISSRVLKHLADFGEVNIFLRGMIPLLGGMGIVWGVVAAFTGHNVTGWASTMCVICFLGGLQLLSLGIIGQYVGKTYMETKHRPKYIVSDRTN